MRTSASISPPCKALNPMLRVQGHGHRSADSLGYFPCTHDPGFWKNDCKFFAPNPGQYIRSAVSFLKAHHNKLEGLVSCRMTIGIVVFLEMVNIYHNDRQVTAESPAALYLIPKKKIKITPIVDAGQGIGE